MGVAVDNRRIARNTLVLYFRMLFQMAVYLYTSRVIIKVLGVVDYGIYDVVAGIITILIFLNNAMTVSTQRFITVALGEGNVDNLRKVYSGGILIHVLLAVVVLILGETVGYWYMTHYMQIPPARFGAAMTVYHCSVVSAMIMVMSVPYNASVIAYERMTAFAAITILDVTLKLIVVCSLPYCSYDKLEAYAVLLMAEALLVRIVYGVYCKTRLKDLRFSLTVDYPLLVRMFNFAKWSMFGNLSYVCNTQGINLVLNIIGGPVVNAARGIAFQVQVAVTSFIASFQTAINPQITKIYAQGDLKSMNLLILRSSRLSFFLTLLMAVPLGLETETILRLWLTDVPGYAVVFTRLLLCVSVVDAVANPLMVGASATGRIRKYHLVVGGILLCTLPLAYLAVRIGSRVEMVFVVQLCMVLVAQCARMMICRDLFVFSVRDFIHKVLLRIACTAALALPLPVFLHIYLPGTIPFRLLVCAMSVLIVAVVVVMVGLEKNERSFVLKKIHL
ncbi:MAG TPA: lipopolysaccharide biosynthesis protein [Alloprevotella sp.]|nr:lipopolysaccharide biosynthesis protein [Alloprevotella sp.]